MGTALTGTDFGSGSSSTVMGSSLAFLLLDLNGSGLPEEGVLLEDGFLLEDLVISSISSMSNSPNSTVHFNISKCMRINIK
jgi:hypothetical protein